MHFIGLLVLWFFFGVIGGFIASSSEALRGSEGFWFVFCFLFGIIGIIIELIVMFFINISYSGKKK